MEDSDEDARTQLLAEVAAFHLGMGLDASHPCLTPLITCAHAYSTRAAAGEQRRAGRGIVRAVFAGSAERFEEDAGWAAGSGE